MMLHAGNQRTAEKSGNAEGVAKRPGLKSWNEQRAHPSRGLRRLLEQHSRRLAWRSSEVEGKSPSDGQKNGTTNFREKTL
jgi:hypothetical protein